MQLSFEESGVPAGIIEFSSLDRRGDNVEATLEGSLAGTEDEKYLWLTSHMDSVYNAGANDDASGLVSILAAARALKQIDPKHTVHFVAYDLEEFYDSYYEEHFYDEGFYEVYHSGELSLVGSSRYVGDVVSEVREREGEEAIIGNVHTAT